MSSKSKEIFQDYHTVGVCIMSPTYFCVLLERDEGECNTEEFFWSQLCTYDLENVVGGHWGSIRFEGTFVSPIAVHTKVDEFLVTDRVGHVYYCGVGKNKQFEDRTSGMFGLKNIHGAVYGVAPLRTVYKRLGVDEWSYEEELRNIPGVQQTSEEGFWDTDGFNQNDIYAVGGERDVWHFNGENWNPIDIGRRPFHCKCVVCAEDGYVYIGGENGAIARGRGDEWKTYFPEGDEEDFFSIVSYRGRVFAGTEEDTFIIGEDLIPQPYDFEGQLHPIAGRFMYAAYDRLLIASNFNQVAFFDGEKWLDINGCGELTPVEEARLLHKKMKQVEEAKEELIDLMDTKD